LEPKVDAAASHAPNVSPDRPAVVLIVDDTPDGREIYSLHLQHKGFTVLTARDGNEGVEMARQHPPDVVIMDLAMARMDGITATKRLKRDARTRRTPVIILTAYPEKAVQQRALEAGASVFLTKPCLPDELEQQIRRLIDLPTR
jgi:two-component system, cell cycle response regulator DivK